MKTNPNHPITHLKDCNGRTFSDDEHYEPWVRDCKPMIGLTKREYFAAMAMQGYLASMSSGVIDKPEYVAMKSVAYADALIAELNKE